MLPLKQILCPIDFSEHSLRALNNAVELAEKFFSEIHLVHVIAPFPLLPATPYPVNFDLKSYEVELKETTLVNLNRIMDKHIPEHIKVNTRILHGDASSQIINYADENNIDLIALATHGTGALKHFLFGSVAEKVLRHSKCPVLTIRVF